MSDHPKGQPYARGIIAYVDGEPISVIPEDLTLTEYEEWREGWEYAHASDSEGGDR